MPLPRLFSGVSYDNITLYILLMSGISFAYYIIKKFQKSREKPIKTNKNKQNNQKVKW